MGLKVLPRKAGVTLDALALHVAGDGGRIAVPLMVDQTFVLPDDAAVGANAMVRFNREAGDLAWRADIRSPGLPPSTRRLGDLLLECQAMMIARLPDPCRTVPINLYQFADRPVSGITLVAGTRRSVLPAAMLHGPSAPMLPALRDWTLLRERVYAVNNGYELWLYQVGVAKLVDSVPYVNLVLDSAENKKVLAILCDRAGVVKKYRLMEAAP